MGRRGAKALHFALVLLGVVLYVVFVLPRWWVLTGDIPTAVATAGRIAAGIPIALAALPALSILKLALGRKARTPELALRLRAWSAVLHVVAGVLIVATAVVEIWLRLAVGGPYLFAVYGAAGAIAILAVLALYLSFVAEKPPAPPKPPKPPKPAKAKKAKAKQAKAKQAKAKQAKAKQAEAKQAEADKTETPAALPAETVAVDTESAVDAETTDTADEAADESAEAGASETTEVVETAAETEPAEDEALAGGLRNKRPAGKTRRRFGR